MARGSGLTQKQEIFACKVAEGETYADAYRHAYNAENMAQNTIWVKASVLMADGKVAARVAELQERAAKMCAVTIASLTKELDEDRELARSKDMPSAAISAVMGKAKLHGLIVNKAEITRKRSIEDLDDAEIDALIASAEGREGEAGERSDQPSSLH